MSTLLLLFLLFQSPDSNTVDNIISWANTENVRSFSDWLRKYPDFIPQAGANLPDALKKKAFDDSLLQQYEKTLQPTFELFQIHPTVVLLDEPGQVLFVVGSKYVGISLGFKKTNPATLRALVCQELVLASLRQALSLAKPKDAYQLKLRAYFIATVASLFLDDKAEAIQDAVNLRYQIDLQIGTPIAREGISQASKKYTCNRAIEWWNGTKVALTSKG